MQARSEGVAGIVGREGECTVLREFLDSDPATRALVLVGGPGIGKTTLWEAGITIARECGWRVLCARPSSAEAQLSFAALIDLLDGVDLGALAVPGPQLAALEVALLRAQPTGAPPPPHAIAHGFLNAVRALAGDGRLLVAIDDVQWLDSPSADVLAFAARRLGRQPVAFLLATRPGRPSVLERGLESAGVERLRVGPLSLGATRRLLSERLGLNLSRQLLRRIVESTLGNPLFALEIGRELVESGLPEIGEDLPVPDAVEDIAGLEVRCRGLRPSGRGRKPAGSGLRRGARTPRADDPRYVRPRGAAGPRSHACAPVLEPRSGLPGEPDDRQRRQGSRPDAGGRR